MKMAKQTTLEKMLKLDSQITEEEKTIANSKEKLSKLRKERKILSQKYKEEQNEVMLKILNDNGIETPELVKEILIKSGFAKFKDIFQTEENPLYSKSDNLS